MTNNEKLDRISDLAVWLHQEILDMKVDWTFRQTESSKTVEGINKLIQELKEQANEQD